MLKQETFYEVQSWGCVSALLGLPAELIPHNFPEVETSGKEMLKQETFYEVQSWGCVSALLGLPAELNPQMSCLVPDDVCNYTSRRGACQQFFENFLQQKIPAGRVPGGDREAEKCSFEKRRLSVPDGRRSAEPRGTAAQRLPW